jgi:hypothetical protein
MLDFIHTCTQASIRLKIRKTTHAAFSLHFWLVLAGFLAVQLMHNRLQGNGVNLLVWLKIQIA